MIARDRDPALRRIERDSLVACLAGTAGAAVSGRIDAALGVLGGFALAAASYVAIRSAVDRIVGAARGDNRPSAGRRHLREIWLVARLAGRYALLGFAAYVMIARLRLHPIGLLVGVSSPVVAAAAEAVRTLWAARASRNP